MMYTDRQWRTSNIYPDWRVSPAPGAGGIDRACYFDNELEARVWLENTRTLDPGVRLYRWLEDVDDDFMPVEGV